jgi:hypothetical protein
VRKEGVEAGRIAGSRRHNHIRRLPDPSPPRHRRLWHLPAPDLRKGGCGKEREREGVVEAQIPQVRADDRATTHRSGLHRTELCWRIEGKAAVAKSREGDGGGGEEESKRKGGGGEGEGREGSEVRVQAPGWGGGY